MTENIRRYKPNWDETQERFIAWWQGNNLGRPMLNLRVKRDRPIDNGAVFRPPVDPEEKHLNLDLMIANYRHHLAHYAFPTETFPHLNVVAGLPILAMYCGGEPQWLPDTVWIGHFVEDWRNFSGFEFTPDNPWYQRHLTMLQRAVAMADGEFFIDMPDLMERMDVIAAVRGAQDLCLDMYDCPELLHRNLAVLDETFNTCYRQYYNLIKDEQGGNSMIAFHIWGPGPTAKIQCDFSAMMAPDQFCEFVIPGLKKQCAEIDYTMYHLDGKDAIVHLDALMTLEQLNCLQWTAGAGQPGGGSELWYPIYEKARRHGKGLWIGLDGSLRSMVDEADQLVKHLGPEGLYFHFCAEFTESEAADLIRHAETHWC